MSPIPLFHNRLAYIYLGGVWGRYEVGTHQIWLYNHGSRLTHRLPSVNPLFFQFKIHDCKFNGNWFNSNKLRLFLIFRKVLRKTNFHDALCPMDIFIIFALIWKNKNCHWYVYKHSKQQIWLANLKTVSLYFL